MTETKDMALQAEAPAGDRTTSRWRRDWTRALVAAAAVAAVLFVVSTWAYTSLPPGRYAPTPHAPAPSGYRWLEAWSWWDGTWYAGIAEHGYDFTFGQGRQSAVAFFPAYPLATRTVAVIAGNPVLAGFLVTLVSGLAASVLFYGWSVPRVGRKAAWVALAALLLYPCSFYLFGALYADALLLLFALGAFVLLERGQPVLAGLAGALATATRPTALALVVGLWLRALERRGAFAGRGSLRAAIRGLRPRDAGLLFAPAGFLAYTGYLWLEYGSPFLFAESEKSWGQEPGWRTWLKVAFFERISQPPYFDPLHFHLVGNLLATLLGLVLTVVVVRRFGWGYGLYTVTLLLGAAISTKNFIGMGRYLLGAFPCFAAVAVLLERRPSLRWPVLATSGVLLVVLSAEHARNHLIS